MLLPADHYYADRPVSHCAQGDLYADLPSTWATAVPQRDVDRGARKRPFDFFGGESAPDHLMQTHPAKSLAIVCNYTCGFMAQPSPGTAGYSHQFRQIAPVVPLAQLVNKKAGLQPTAARQLKEHGFASGLLYLPRPDSVPKVATENEEFTPDDYVACLFRMTTVDQSLLDNRVRVARLTEEAQRILISAVQALMGPKLFDPWEHHPDLSSSWPVDVP